MRILLDENLDWRLKRGLPGHTVKSVPLIGWAGVKNGELLARASQNFDVLVTMDNSLPKQQNLKKHAIAVIGLKAPSNRLADTRPLMPQLLAVLPTAKPHTITMVPQS